MDDRNRPSEQLPLFPHDRASDLSRALLDTAYLVVQARAYLTDDGVADLFSTLAYFRQRLDSVTYIERVVRGLVQLPRHQPQRASAPIQQHPERVKIAS